jgi:predicted chitinase
MITVSRHDLDRLCPRPKSGIRQQIWDQYATAIESAAPLFACVGIKEGLTLAHVLSQWGAETGGFTLLWESGNYSAARIVQIFGKGRHSARVTQDEAEDIADLPTANDQRAKALFERVYGLGNPKKARELGNVNPGDGYRYRGFGIQQITGRTDHEKYLQGDYTAERAIEAALREWMDKGCTADAEADDCLAVTRKINGGTNGIQTRKALLAQAKEIWLDEDHPAAVAEDHENPLLGPPVPASVAETATGQSAVISGTTGGGLTVAGALTLYHQANEQGLFSPHNLMPLAIIVGAVAIIALARRDWIDRGRKLLMGV